MGLGYATTRWDSLRKQIEPGSSCITPTILRPDPRNYPSAAYLVGMLRYLLPFLLLFIGPICTAQRYGEHWQFGYRVGLDFSDCAPKVIRDGSNTGFEGSAAVSNDQGVLQFYTNSRYVWNRLHELMPNGELTDEGNTLSQVLIQKVPLTTSLYYIFTTTAQASGAGGFRYHVVDMEADGGLGDVVLSDQVLFAGTSTEHVAATYHANGTDVWIMCRAYPNAQFRAYLLTPEGIVDPPVVSVVGPPLIGGNSNFNTRGELKFSLDGTRMAIACNGIAADDATDLVAVYSFDNSTGVVSNAIVLDPGRGDFGLSFSPDGSKLYGATWKAFGFTVNDANILYQFDLTSGIPSIINASRTTIHSASETLGSLKLGPDGRIYLAADGRPYLGVINEPDSLGLACNYVHNGLFLDGDTCSYGLNNYIEYVNCDPAEVPVTDLVAHQASLSVYPNPTNGMVWFTTSSTQGPISLRVTDPAGRILHHQRSYNERSLDLSNYAPGKYQIQVCFSDGQCVDRVVNRVR